MIYVLLLLLIAGVFTKLADYFTDEEKRNRIAGYLSGAIYGSLLAHIIHYVGIGCMLLVFSFLGLPQLNIFLVIFFLAGGIIDEVGNDQYDKGKIRGFSGKLFEYRITLDIFALAYSAFTGLWIVFISMAVFDLGYEIAGKTAKKVKL
jgi:hypothetical protein